MSFQYQHHQHEVRHIRLNTTTTFFLFETKEKKKLHLSDFSVNKLKGKFEIIYPQLTSPVYISLSLVSDTEFCVHTAHAKDQRVTSIHSFRTGSQGTSIRQGFFYTPVCGAGLPKPGDTSSRNIQHALLYEWVHLLPVHQCARSQRKDCNPEWVHLLSSFLPRLGRR